MFTGIIESMGEIISLTKEGTNIHIEVKSSITQELKIDQSLAHNGVCLTVVKINKDNYVVTAIKETLDKSNIGDLKVGDKGVDYNGNVVEIIAIDRFAKVAKMFKKEMRANPEEYGIEELSVNTDYYFTKNIESAEASDVGAHYIYPVRYDMANYWGLDPLDESVVTENYEVIYSDGVAAGKKFKSEKQALDFMYKTIDSNKKLRDIAVYKPGMHSTTQTELVVSFWGNGSYLDNVSKKDPKLAAKKLEESVVTEGRSVNKIQKEWNQVTTDMIQKVAAWKAAEGDRKAEILEELKALTAKKKALESELDVAVAGKDKDVQLVVSEGNAFGAARAEAIANGASTFTVDGEEYDVEDVDAEDKKNSEEFVEESEILWDALIEKFTVTNEDLRSDIKKYIKTNKKEIDALADQDDWDRIYSMLMTDFEVEEDDDKAADELKTIFNIVY